MGRTCIEVCLISARGLKRTPSLFKLQWFAVAWIDPNDKYCTRVDSSSNGNPIWKTKFTMSLDDKSDRLNNSHELAVHVEVYSREPIFLRQTLFGTSTIVLKEFLDKYGCDRSEVGPSKRVVVEEVGSFQLRRKGGGSSKPRGFVDVSIRIRDDEAACSSSYNTGVNEVFDLMRNCGCINLDNHSYGSSDSFHRTPPPQMPPSNNIGYNHNSFPVPSSVAQGGQQRVNGPGFSLGLGAGALTAGSVLFGSGSRVDARFTTDFPF